jgi:putative flavoprotein involved in K+ transport
VVVVSTVVVGAGQAGLAVSRALTELEVEHVVLERARVGQAWRDRWDSFTLVTPNWTMDLSGSPYAGDDPEGHVPRDEIVAYLEDYAAGAPIREGARVDALRAGAAARFQVSTSEGDLDASTVVVCTGAYQRQFRPAAVSGFPPGVLVLDAHDYRNPHALPDGQVLIVGSGQTGCQLAEELHFAGRDVFLACGRAPWVPRRLDGLDIVTWLTRTSFYDQNLAELPSPSARLLANVQTTGAGGGHDLHYRSLQSLGVWLLGRLAGVDGNRASFADDLGASVAFGDARWADSCQLMKAELPARGYAVPELPIPAPFTYDPVWELDLRAVGAVIVTSGFRPDYRWIDFPITDEMGFPITEDGASTIVPGLYFCGVHFLRTRRSSLLFGVSEDAAIVARLVADAERTHRTVAQISRLHG